MVASPTVYGRRSVDPNLDLLREIKGAVDPRKFNTGRALANPVSRASLFLPRSQSHLLPRKGVEVLPALTASLRLRKPVST